MFVFVLNCLVFCLEQTVTVKGLPRVSLCRRTGPAQELEAIECGFRCVSTIFRFESEICLTSVF